MSKIYEALRQAELDRIGQAMPESRNSATAVLEPPMAEAPAPSGARASASVDAHPAPVIPPASASAAVKNPESAEPPFDFDEVRAAIWEPAIHRLPALEQRGSGVEQFRSLRSRMYEFRDLNTLKSILVSSGLPQEGKSFVTTNLAIALARHKAGRVLLIDGDMRRPSQHKMLGCSEGPGLSEYLAGQATLYEVLQRPVTDATHTPPPGLASLTLIPGGRDSDKAADLAGNRRFDRLIEIVSPHFDWIVVDSSPVNLVSDAVNLARACDGVLLVARGAVTKYEAAQRALGEFKASRILGFVLNAVQDPKVTGGGYYGYDGYDRPAE